MRTTLRKLKLFLFFAWDAFGQDKGRKLYADLKTAWMLADMVVR